MKKMLRNVVSLVMVVALMLPLFQTEVFAASTSFLPSVSTSKPIKGYCYRVNLSGNRVRVYTNSACNKYYSSEYIDALSDECWITSRSSSYNNAYVSYPTSSNRKSRWVKMSAFTTQTSYKTMYASGWIQTYKFPWKSGGTYGNIDVNDTVRVYETTGGFVRVIYPVSGGYKFAWITSDDYGKYLSTEKPVQVQQGTYVIYTALNSKYALDVNNYATFNGGNVEITSLQVFKK